MNFTHPFTSWKDKKSYLEYLDLRQQPKVAGLPFLGYMEGREAYRLPFQLEFNETTLDVLNLLALEYGGTLELSFYPKILVTDWFEPLVELFDWQEIPFLLIPSDYPLKSILVRDVLEAVVFGHLH